MSHERLFADQAQAYAAYRPTYPRALFEYVASLAPGRGLAIDCGTGNGQAAAAIAEFFDRVIAIDPSEQQLKLAPPHPRISYAIGRAEKINANDGSADLVTVAQALHWFHHETFFPEVDRVLRPGGIVAAWCYQMCRVAPGVDEIIDHFYRVTTAPYWSPQRTLVDEGYQSIAMPFEEIRPMTTFRMTVAYDAKQLLGYLSSWSAVQECKRTNGRDLVAEVRPALERAWGDVTEKREVTWPLSMRIGRK